jgi:NhaP-type Na+/H+ or K+/H+ antiporter
MYLELTIIAMSILVYSIIAGKVDRLPISGPILFVLLGLLVGPLVMNFYDLHPSAESIRTLAELALALVLFTDASKTNLRSLEHNAKLPVRLLLIGLPLTIVAGTAAGFIIFPGFSWIELAIIATMLAPTDAALGKPVVTNPKVPSRIREALNVESGLNDGISVPVLFLLIALSEAHEISDVSIQFGLGLFLKQIGIGLLVGVAVTYLGDRLIQYSLKRKWVESTWKPIIIAALAFSIFSIAQVLGGSGFIACFTGGVIYGSISKKNKGELLLAAEGTADTLSLITWFIFGSVGIAAYLPHFTWDVIIYAMISLTVVRIVPVLISLLGSGIPMRQQLFMGWFGPRGLASIVFAIMIMDIELPHQETIILTALCTILLSVFAHGLTAKPLVNLLSKRANHSKTKKS